MSRPEPLASSGCVTLDAPRPIESPLGPAELRALAAVRRRPELFRAPIYTTHAEAIASLTSGLEFGLPARAAPRPERRFVRAVAWNIERGKSLEGLIDYVRREPLLREADVFLLNEVDVGMARSQNRHVAAELAGALGFAYVFGNSYLCLSRGNVRDGGDGDNRLGLHGNAILSRYPLRRAESFGLAITKDKFHSSEKRLGHKKALWAEVETPLGLLPVCAVHLDSGGSPAQRGAQLEDVMAKLDERGLSRCLLGGDLNTTTYDTQSLPRLLWNILQKLWRGGFAHALHHYLRPYLLYEAPVFQALLAHGFDWKGFNQEARGTARYEVGAFESESKVLEHLPRLALAILRYKLRPWGGVAALKVDWFCGRGLRALGDGELEDGDDRARRSQAPTSLEKPRAAGRLLSDHDPVVVDVVFE